ncbi:MAG: rhomboid family intramembrane serine protease [Bacteroidales bacterium]|nr:rhomboid family intramembrane serine protease [Bacteroidales bacterium]
MLTFIVIAVTVIVSFLAFNNLRLFDQLKFNAYLIKQRNEGWRFFSYALVHAGWAHLLINMFVLYSFGAFVEEALKDLFGSRGFLYYLMLYVGGVLFSTLWDFGKFKNDPYYSAVGASGAVSAVVFASILLNPGSSIFLFPIPFPLPSWVFGIVYLVYSAYMGKKGTDNIGHTAHFWGAVYGIALVIVLVPGVISNFFSTIF